MTAGRQNGTAQTGFHARPCSGGRVAAAVGPRALVNRAQSPAPWLLLAGVWPALLGTWLALVLCAGCTTDSARAGSPAAAAIHELNVLSMPVALNLDGKPGADGIAIKVFASNQDEPKAVPIRKGHLEIVAYDGNLDTAPGAKPFHTWRFSAADLAGYEFTTALGTGYNLVLSWAPQQLTRERVVVIARYLPPKGPPVVSAPSSIAGIVR